MNPSKRVDRAARLYREFTGHEADSVDRVVVPFHDTLILVGECEKIFYNAVRDGIFERYVHTFKARSRPLLCSSHDGSSLYLIDGSYRFTDAGITDT